jgi:hypothetical protein
VPASVEHHGKGGLAGGIGLGLGFTPVLLVASAAYLNSFPFSLTVLVLSPIAAIAGLVLCISVLRSTTGAHKYFAIFGVLVSGVLLLAMVVILIVFSTGSAVWS